MKKTKKRNLNIKSRYSIFFKSEVSSPVILMENSSKGVLLTKFTQQLE